MLTKRFGYSTLAFTTSDPTHTETVSSYKNRDKPYYLYNCVYRDLHSLHFQTALSPPSLNHNFTNLPASSLLRQSTFFSAQLISLVSFLLCVSKSLLPFCFASFPCGFHPSNTNSFHLF